MTLNIVEISKTLVFPGNAVHNTDQQTPIYIKYVSTI